MDPPHFAGRLGGILGVRPPAATSFDAPLKRRFEDLPLLCALALNTALFGRVVRRRLRGRDREVDGEARRGASRAVPRVAGDGTDSRVLELRVRTCNHHATGMQPACNRHAIGMQPACNRHAIGMQSACNRHAIGMQSAGSSHVLEPRVRTAPGELEGADDGVAQARLGHLVPCPKPHVGEEARLLGLR